MEMEEVNFKRQLDTANSLICNYRISTGYIENQVLELQAAIVAKDEFLQFAAALIEHRIGACHELEKVKAALDGVRK